MSGLSFGFLGPPCLVCSISRSWRCHWCWWLSLKSNRLGRLSPQNLGWFGWPKTKSLETCGEKFKGSHFRHFRHGDGISSQDCFGLSALEAGDIEPKMLRKLIQKRHYMMPGRSTPCENIHRLIDNKMCQVK